MHAAFRNGLRKPCKGLGDYYVRSDAFTCLQGPEEDNRTFNKKQIRWFLEQYRLLKEAAQSAQVRPFFAEINNIRPLSISAAEPTAGSICRSARRPSAPCRRRIRRCWRAPIRHPSIR